MSEELNNSPIDNFDWDAYENGETQGAKTREEQETTYDASLNTIKDKDVTDGTIISLNKREVVV
ncbi:MAG: 30S ribosomal protein S1, partial [Muribaculaceae bacterium]